MMNKIFFKVFLYLLLSVPLKAQTFIHLKDIENEFERLGRNYLVQPKTIELESELSSNYDSCHVHVLYKISNYEVVSKEIPRVNCFCKNGNKKSFKNSINNKETVYPPEITELLTKINADFNSPIIIVNKIEMPNSGDIYLGAITITFKN